MTRLQTNMTEHELHVLIDLYAFTSCNWFPGVTLASQSFLHDERAEPLLSTACFPCIHAFPFLLQSYRFSFGVKPQPSHEQTDTVS